MTARIKQAISAKPVPEDVKAVARVLNREIVPVSRLMRDVVNLNYEVTYGDGAATTYTYQHNLGTADLVWSIRNTSTGYMVYDPADVTGVNITDTDVTITHAVAPAADSRRLVLRG